MKFESREIEGFPAYRVHNDGSIWSCWRKGPGATLTNIFRCMVQTVDRDGYGRVDLHGETRVSRKVCVLVCTAFHGPCPDGMVCRHLDGNSRNDRADNLAWGTPLKNTDDRRRHGTIAVGESHGKAKLTDAQIADLRSMAGTCTQQQAADKFGVSRGYVGQLWAGTRKRGAMGIT